MAVKVLAAADLHLGRRSASLPANDERLASKNAWQRLVQWAIDKEVDVVALAGDIVDQDNSYYESIGPLQAGFDLLGQAGIKVFMVSGNHDYRVLPQLISPRYPNVHLLGSSGQWESGIFRKEGETVQFVGRSFPSSSPTQTTSPVAMLRADQWDPNYPVIGLIHGDLFDPLSIYCPIRPNDLAATGIRTWVLGHIHKPYEVDLAGTTIHYPGSLQALSAKETGPHGFLLLTIEEHRTSIEKVFLSTARYEDVELSVEGISTREAFQAHLVDVVQRDAETRLPEMGDVRFLSYDIRLIGQHDQDASVMSWASASQNELALHIGGEVIASVRSVECQIAPTIGDLNELAREPSPAGILAGAILALEAGTATPLLTALEAKWENQRRELQRAAVYLPLITAGPTPATPSDGREYLLREFNRLLSQLQQQRRANG